MPRTAAGSILEAQLRVPAEIVVEFIALYSRIEFALKAEGYVTADGRPGQFKIRWDRLENELAPAFDPDVSADLRHAVDYLRGQPPMKQCWNGAQVTWQRVALDRGEVTLTGVLAHVRRARNNLFHGGKFATAPEDSARNREVLEAGLVVLDDVVRISRDRAPRIHSAFYSPNY